MTGRLEIRGLRKGYVQHLQGGGRREVLRGVDLDVAPGELVALRGESGSGKSTLLRCVYRAALPDGGEIRLGGFDLARASEREVLEARQDRMGMVTQFLSVVPRVSARDLLAGEGLEPAAAGDLLSRLGLRAELHDLAPATFSGGERQLVNVALALARARPLVLLDEVTSALDPSRRATVVAALKERKAAGVAMVAVFHDVPGGDLVDREVRLTEGVAA